MWNGKMDPLIISEHSGTTFFMLADILIWEGIMKAIRSSLRLSHWAHNPFVTCLPSTLKASMFLFGFLSALSLYQYQHDTKAYKLCERSYEPQLCTRLLLVSLNDVSIGHQGIHLLINYLRYGPTLHSLHCKPERALHHVLSTSGACKRAVLLSNIRAMYMFPQSYIH